MVNDFGNRNTEFRGSIFATETRRRHRFGGRWRSPFFLGGLRTIHVLWCGGGVILRAKTSAVPAQLQISAEAGGLRLTKT